MHPEYPEDLEWKDYSCSTQHKFRDRRRPDGERGREKVRKDARKMDQKHDGYERQKGAKKRKGIQGAQEKLFAHLDVSFRRACK